MTHLSFSKSDLVDEKALRPIPFRRDLIKLGVVVALGLAAYKLFPSDLSLMTRIVSAAFLVLSLDLLTGYAGIATLGQAVMFGFGAYAAANLSLAGWNDPFLMAAAGSLAGAVSGLLFGAVVLRLHGLAQLVTTIALVQLAHEGANKFSNLTGGSDGLSGIEAAPVLGLFKFDFYGRTGFLFAFSLLILTLIVLAMIVRSPFGLKIRAIGHDAGRVRTMGISVLPTLLVLYTLSGAVAGMGGAIEAIAAGVVGLDSLSFERSATALVMLVLGGTGSLFGALLGTTIFMAFEQFVSATNPFHWLIVIGALLILVVLVLPRGVISIGGEVARLFKLFGLAREKRP